MGGPPPKKRSDVSPSKQKFLPVQKKYQDQIVFSNSPISKTEADPSSFIATWDMIQPLFYRVFRTSTIAEGFFQVNSKSIISHVNLMWLFFFISIRF